MTTWRRIVLASLVAAYCFGLGVVVGVVIERMRFDRQRAVVLARYESLSARMHGHLMVIEASITRHAAADR